jgi:hypothetical protein
LVGWWGFNGNAQDGSGNGNHGTVNGATLTTDRFGNQNGAYSFDGVDDYINVSDHPDLRLTNTDFTIAIWCKIHQYGLPNRIYISKTDGPGNTSKWILWNIAVINGGPSVGFHSNGSQGSFLLSYGSPQISEWHQVVVRKTGSILEIFNDAVFQVYSNTFQMQPSLSDIRIGGDEVNGGGHWHNGKLDDIGIWNRALTQQEITNLYNSQLPIQTSLCLPTITTNTPTSIGIDSVVIGGDILNDGGSSIVLRGVCYSTTPSPNMGNTRTEEGSGIGSFTSTLRNLSPSTTYYARSYAKNSQGVVVYGNEVTFTTTPLAFGMTYAGGIIFDLDSSGQHGLVCAPSDQGLFPWGCYGTDIPNTSTAVGSGATNTAYIMAGCAERPIAASVCADLVLNGYSDWYLPSLGEMQLMYSRLFLQGLVGFSVSYYCSSSQNDPGNASTMYFNNGSVGNFYKGANWLVRAVRAF